MLLWVNVNFKAVLIDSVKRSDLFSLIFRCVQGGLSVQIGFMSLKFFNVSTVGIVCSLTPIFVCIFAFFLLGEIVKIKDIIALFAVMLAAAMVILGA